MMLTIIIVNFNGEQFLANCLDSVLAQRKFFNDFNVIVFDNASTDNSFNIIKPYENDIRLIKNDTNIGFPQAHNVLLPDLTTPYLWLLNNDTEFSHDIDVITPILNHFKTSEDIVGISPKLLNTDGSIQVQGSGFSGLKYKSNRIKKVPFLSGASLFMKTSFFRKIGGFDPNLFFYNDDVDFAMQVKKHHKQLIYYPLVSITHHGGLSTKFHKMETQIGGYIGSLYLCKKYYSPFAYIVYRFFVTLLIHILRIYYSKKTGDQYKNWANQLKCAIHRIKDEL